MPTPFLSIVITTFNRRELVQNAIKSALDFQCDVPHVEIIVVDDASADGTLEVLQTKYAAEIQSRPVRIVALPENRGVTGAKNAGARAAAGEWVMFLDSDDELIAGVAPPLMETLRQSENPIVFFRCQDTEGVPIGHPASVSTLVTVKEYINGRAAGECLPLVRRKAFMRYPYEEQLRGFEGLCYVRIMKSYGPLLLSNITARTYRTDNSDRLSTKAGMRKRSCLLARGHVYLLREGFHFFRPGNFLKQIAKILYYAGHCLLRTLAMIFVRQPTLSEGGKNVR